MDSLSLFFPVSIFSKFSKYTDYYQLINNSFDILSFIIES